MPERRRSSFQTRKLLKLLLKIPSDPAKLYGIGILEIAFFLNDLAALLLRALRRYDQTEFLSVLRTFLDRLTDHVHRIRTLRDQDHIRAARRT